MERFEEKLNAYGGNLKRAAIELAKDWRTDRPTSSSVLGALTLYGFGSICVIRLRQNEPNLPRPFRAPAYPYIPWCAFGLTLVTFSSSAGFTFKDGSMRNFGKDRRVKQPKLAVELGQKRINKASGRLSASIRTAFGTVATSRITEIAIIRHDGTQIIDSYQSLVNPMLDS